MPLFGTDGVRGRAFSELTPELVAALGAAAGSVFGGGTWIVGRDPRESGPVLEAALCRGLAASGATVRRVGVVPTPAVAHLAAVAGAPAAMITASHNPHHDNGVKVFAPGGTKLDDATEALIEAALRDHGEVPAPEVPEQPVDQGAIDDYADHVVGLVATRALDGLHLVVDCANGAMSSVAPVVLRRLGARVDVLHAAPDGRNINADCGATRPESLARAVVAAGASMGLAFDGDGDRVIAVDELGRVVDGDRLLALAALELRRADQLVDDTVVVTVMSNLGFHRAMADAGIRVVTTAVGDRYVLEALEAGGYALGGEQSGHIIYRRLATTGDGLLAGTRLAASVAASAGGGDGGGTLSELAAGVMEAYPQLLVNVRVAERHPDIADELAAEIAAAQAQLGEGRVLVRASGTEPLVRVMVEGRDADIARRVADDLAEIVTDRFGSASLA